MVKHLLNHYAVRTESVKHLLNYRADEVLEKRTRARVMLSFAQSRAQPPHQRVRTDGGERVALAYGATDNLFLATPTGFEGMTEEDGQAGDLTEETDESGVPSGTCVIVERRRS